MIEKGARYLLSILAEESPIRYSRFYDGEEETARKLEDAIGIDDDSRGWYCAEAIIDLAVYELSEQGIVKTKQLTENLADGERDYEIYLTDQGKQHDDSKSQLKFWDAE